MRTTLLIATSGVARILMPREGSQSHPSERKRDAQRLGRLYRELDFQDAAHVQLALRPGQPELVRVQPAINGVVGSHRGEVIGLTEGAGYHGLRQMPDL